MKDKKIAFFLRIEKPIADKIKKLAEAERRSTTNFIENILANHTKKNG